MRRLGVGLLIAILVLSGCASHSLQNDIVGSWVNSSGYTIEFQANGGGLIPGVAGKLLDTPFTYSVVDESHISIAMLGQKYTIQIKIDGDKLTWTDTLGDEVYTRVKK